MIEVVKILVIKTLSHLYYKLVNCFVEEVQFDDGVGDFRLLSQRAIKSIASLEEYNRFSKGYLNG